MIDEPTKNSGHRMSKTVCNVLFVGFVLMAMGCKSSDSTQTKRLTLLKGTKADVGNAITPPPEPPNTIVRNVLPPALKPHQHVPPSFGAEGERPCGVLTDKVCALLGQGAEECAVARSRVKRRARSVSEERCQRTLDWYRIHTDEGRRGYACRHLSNALCRLYGQESSECVAANALASRGNLTEREKAACLADVLLVKGLP